jgi:signal transduction histidine kinase
MNKARLPFPWLSVLLGLLLVSWQLLLAKPQWIAPYELAAALRQDEYLLASLGIWLLLVIFEIYRFYRARQIYRQELSQYEDQISDLFESKRELGTRARTYSSHAEKLKLFISDKLLEYIEYDEKFLHFKNIASEVRHNGVISYDRAQTALKQASEFCAAHLDDPGKQQQFDEAADSLHYLWDLLDIATTDNIALHVANRIYDCEEYYFQAQLNKSDASESPYAPTFSMFSAVHKALAPFAEDSPAFALLGLEEVPLSYLDRRFQLLVKGNAEMIGNRNHMVLLIENLLNNAFFYADQKASKTRYNRVTVKQAVELEQVVLEVYNRGPRIKDEDRDRIFQLGYSSRRVRDHHGKGLGLYFVNEICKGFEGSIEVDNIENHEDHLSFRVELNNREIETHFVSMTVENGRALSLVAESDKPRRSQDWSFSSPIKSVEISSKGRSDPQILELRNGTETTIYQDSDNVLRPRWVVEIINRRRSSRMVFKPVDVRGVSFTIKFPTAISRLESQEMF